VPAKRGDRVTPPPSKDGWDARFASSDAAKGWEELCRLASGSAREAWTVLTEHPNAPRNPARQHRLRGSLATRSIDGKKLDQWQYEVTGAGRIWYCPDPDRADHLAGPGGHGSPEGDRVTRPAARASWGPFVPSFVPRNAADR
jgi:hypothetical protein